VAYYHKTFSLSWQHKHSFTWWFMLPLRNNRKRMGRGVGAGVTLRVVSAHNKVKKGQRGTLGFLLKRFLASPP